MKMNVVFQVIEQGDTWESARIVYILREVSEDYNVTDIADVISTLYRGKAVRFARLFADEIISVEQANRHSGGYYQTQNYMGNQII